MSERKDLAELLDTVSRKQMITVLSWLVGIAVGLIVAVYFLYFSNFYGKYSNDPAVWGQFGDFVGGTINPLLTFLSFLALVFTVVLQTRQLEHSREELQRTMQTQIEASAMAKSQAEYANVSAKLAALQAALAVTSELLLQAQEFATLDGPGEYAQGLLQRKEKIAGEILRISDELTSSAA